MADRRGGGHRHDRVADAQGAGRRVDLGDGAFDLHAVIGALAMVVLDLHGGAIDAHDNLDRIVIRDVVERQACVGAATGEMQFDVAAGDAVQLEVTGIVHR